jgi:hypothetical protein
VAAPERVRPERGRRGGLARRVPGADALGNLVRPFHKTGRYYLQSWRDYLGATPQDLPVARPTVAVAAQAFWDELALIGLLARWPVSEPRAFQRITDEVLDGSSSTVAKAIWMSHSAFSSRPRRWPSPRQGRR